MVGALLGLTIPIAAQHPAPGAPDSATTGSTPATRLPGLTILGTATDRARIPGSAQILDRATLTQARVVTTNEALQKQVDLLNQIGSRPVTTGTTTATTTASTTTAPTIAGSASGAGVAVFDAAVAQALVGVRDAVNAVERAVSRIPTRSAVGGG